jgi:hypothetical protein
MMLDFRGALDEQPIHRVGERPQRIRFFSHLASQLKPCPRVNVRSFGELSP